MDYVKDLIKEFCEAEGYEFRDNYSGRFMYGQRCVGIVTDEQPIPLIVSLFGFLAEESELDCYNIERMLKGAKTDDMGLSTIIYFPEIKA